MLCLQKNKTMKSILIGSDHAGFKMKMNLKKYLENKGYQVLTFGAVKEEKAIDYPDVALETCRYFRDNPGSVAFGILVCGTGIGMAIAANRFDGVRCALVHDYITAEYAKKHNHANFIALGSRVSHAVSVETILTAYMDAKEEYGRHQRRVDKMSDLHL